MRLVMMGTGPFAVPTFESLLDSPHEVVALITRPSPPPRGRRPPPVNPMRQAAEARGAPVFAPDSINSEEAVQQLAGLGADLLVVCDYGQILKPAALATAPLGGVNLHGSLLPRYRGAAPINWAVWNGEQETGVTVIHMTPKLDGGPILAIRQTPIGPDETNVDLEPRLARLGVAAVHESLELLAGWDRTSPIGRPQDPALVSLAPRLKKTDGAIDWSQPAVRIRNQVRALQPWPGTYTHWRKADGELLRLILDTVTIVDAEKEGLEPGLVVHSDRSSLHVATGCGVLGLDRAQPAGKRPIAIREFLRGYPIRTGDRLIDDA